MRVETTKFGDPEQTLAVAAFERDNFGDLLYGSMTRGLLGPNIVCAAPTGADMRDEFGEYVHSYEDLKDRLSTIGRLWVAGGGIGGVTIDAALQMSNRETPTGILPKWFVPYLPQLEVLGPFNPRVSVINSVGLAGIVRYRPRTFWSAYRVLRRADFLSVREQKSYHVLKSLGLRPRIAPDIVHAIERVVDLPNAPKDFRGQAVVQFRASLYNDRDLQHIAQSLARCEILSRSGVVFMCAGEAPGHDSRESYEALVRKLKVLRSDFDVSILGKMSALEKVAVFRDAPVVVTTSLHAQVLSIAFKRPHVMLELEKSRVYAESWGNPMPHGVAIEAIPEAMAVALETSKLDELKRVSDRLSEESLQNAREAASL